MLVILIVVNTWYYNRVNTEKSELLYNNINIYHKIISSGLIENIKKIILGYPLNTFDNNLIFNSKIFASDNGNKKIITITPYSIEISNLQNVITIDLISFKEYFVTLLPAHIDCSVNLDNIELIKNNFNEARYTNSLNYGLGNGLILKVNLSINPNSVFYLEYEKQIKVLLQKFRIVSTAICLLTICIYFISYSALNRKLDYLKMQLDEEKSHVLYSNKKLETSANLNISFIRKATEMYLDEMGVDNEQLFPLVLFDNSSNKLDLINLKKQLEEYFIGFSNEFILNINSESNTIYYPLGKEVLYQLVFSIIRDIIFITREQTEKQKVINVSFNEEGIKFEFFAFPSSISQINKLSKIINENHPEMFLLDFNRILMSLAKHNIAYELNNNGNRNIFKMVFTENVMGQEKIIKFNRKIK